MNTKQQYEEQEWSNVTDFSSVYLPYYDDQVLDLGVQIPLNQTNLTLPDFALNESIVPESVSCMKLHKLSSKLVVTNF